jgi:hypothetical protein
MDDLDDHLAGRHRLDDIGADGAGAHLVGEGADDFQRHVRFEQGAAHFAHGLVDVALRERAATLELVENAGQPSRQSFEHACSPFISTARNTGSAAIRPKRFRARGRNRAVGR